MKKILSISACAALAISLSLATCFSACAEALDDKKLQNLQNAATVVSTLHRFANVQIATINDVKKNNKKIKEELIDSNVKFLNSELKIRLANEFCDMTVYEPEILNLALNNVCKKLVPTAMTWESIGDASFKEKSLYLIKSLPEKILIVAENFACKRFIKDKMVQFGCPYLVENFNKGIKQLLDKKNYTTKEEIEKWLEKETEEI